MLLTAGYMQAMCLSASLTLTASHRMRARHLAGTAGLNVPMFIALRRFTLLFTILLERFWLKKSHDWPTLSAMGIMIGGGSEVARSNAWLLSCVCSFSCCI